LVRRLQQQRGFGLLELLMAMTVLNVGILAIVAAFNSGALALSRASKTSTATALADSQMELFRGLTYTNIEQTTSGWTSATGDSTWTADSTYQTNMANPLWPKALIPTVTSCPNSNTNSCNPELTVTGPDGRSYRIDTYMYYDRPTTQSTTTTSSVTLPASTIPVASTSGFASTASSIMVGGQTVSYTGVTATSFTGCTGGSGTLASGSTVTGGPTGEQIKVVTVVVRDVNKLASSLARETSTFDTATGS
jgi:Tfp pilus assembly protein PilV